MSWSKSVSALVFDEVLYVGLAVCFFEKLFNKIKGGGFDLSCQFSFSSDTIGMFLPQILIIFVSEY